MTGIVKVLKSIYDFFAGDHIILSGVAIAFVAGALLVAYLGRLMAVDVVVFVALILAGLVVTLGREKRGQDKA